MQNRLRIWPVALLAVVTTSIADNSAWAQLTARSAVDGRQRVRTALAVALADGTLSRAEEDSVYCLGERLLTPQELPGLQRTLSRLAGRQEASPPAPPPESVQDQPTERPSPDPTTQSGLILPEKRDLTESASYQEPAADKKPAAENHQPAADVDQESPFQEGGTLEAGELLDDERLVFEGEYYNAFPGMFVGLQSLAADGWRNLSLYTTVEAFKGPLDLDDRNGNFGLGFALNTGIPLASRLGVGLQAGTSAVLSNFYGTQFTGATIRSQNFTTAGIFQQAPFLDRNLKWGFVYDWLNDDYYTTFMMGQWRVKLAYELDPCREIGIWACIPDKGDTARLGSRQTGLTIDRFKPVTQGSLYYRRCWQGGIGTAAWLGLAEEPGQFVFGTDARIPITGRLALVGNFNYVLPSASAQPGQDEEMWNVSLGIELTPCWGANRCHNTDRYAPLFPLANNGTFAIRRF
jgi:hypothetical protein